MLLLTRLQAVAPRTLAITSGSGRKALEVAPQGPEPIKKSTRTTGREDFGMDSLARETPPAQAVESGDRNSPHLNTAASRLANGSVAVGIMLIRLPRLSPAPSRSANDSVAILSLII